MVWFVFFFTQSLLSALVFLLLVFLHMLRKQKFIHSMPRQQTDKNAINNSFFYVSRVFNHKPIIVCIMFIGMVKLVVLLLDECWCAYYKSGHSLILYIPYNEMCVFTICKNIGKTWICYFSWQSFFNIFFFTTKSTEFYTKISFQWIPKMNSSFVGFIH